jgi:hypothetical protein
VLRGEQVGGEGLVAAGHGQPQVEAAGGAGCISHWLQDRQHAVELAPVQRAVGGDMPILAPGGDAGFLRGYRHGAAMVGAVQQEWFDQRSIAGHESGAQARQARTLGE